MMLVRLCTPLFVGRSSFKITSFGLKAANRRSMANTRTSAASEGLESKHCVPCEKEGGALNYMGLCDTVQSDEKISELLSQLHEAWEVVRPEAGSGPQRLRRQWKTKGFKGALALCDKIGEIADQEGHHPDLHITGWNHLIVEVFTHARQGLTENDFILAAKLDRVDTAGLLAAKKKKLADA